MQRIVYILFVEWETLIHMENNKYMHWDDRTVD